MKKKSNINKILFISLTVLFFLHLFFRIYSYRGEYLSTYDHEYWEDRYFRSQWVIPNSKEPIGDDGLFAYEGFEYIQGRDPTELNAEVPPLGKYLIGLSILIFGNQNVFALISGLFALTALYIFNLGIFKNFKTAFIPVALFSFEPMFYTQLRAPFLDLLYLGLLLMIFYLLIKKRYVYSSVFLGLMAATKTSIATFALVGAVIYTYFLFIDIVVNKIRKITYPSLKKYLLYLPVSVISFLMVYIVYFLKGNSLWDFLGVQKWIFTFYEIGAKGEPFAVIWLLLSGQWINWFSSAQKVTDWHPGWPVLLVLSLIASFLIIKQKKKNGLVLIAVWIIIYLLFLSAIPVWPRYLLLLLPFMYNLFVWLFIESIRRWKGVKGLKGMLKP
jgi:predicted membrane-bound dolichyl-phosphate-mannose-protein mannosyltransferase